VVKLVVAVMLAAAGKPVRRFVRMRRVFIPSTRRRGRWPVAQGMPDSKVRTVAAIGRPVSVVSRVAGAVVAVVDVAVAVAVAREMARWARRRAMPRAAESVSTLSRRLEAKSMVIVVARR
jgi:NaMN:DMB phosphoribosyltransferase